MNWFISSSDFQSVPDSPSTRSDSALISDAMVLALGIQLSPLVLCFQPLVFSVAMLSMCLAFVFVRVLLVFPVSLLGVGVWLQEVAVCCVAVSLLVAGVCCSVCLCCFVGRLLMYDSNWYGCVCPFCRCVIIVFGISASSWCCVSSS